MNSNRHIALCFLGLLAMFTRGCEKEGPPGMGGPWVKGTLEGTIGVYDEFGIPLDERSDFTVTVQSAGLHASTDSEGYFRIDSLPTGTYDIICKKEGFVDGIVVGYQFIGGGTQTYDYISMVPPSTTDVVDLQLGMVDENTIWIAGSIFPLPGEDEPRSIMLFFSDNDNVRYNRYLYATQIDLDLRMFEDFESFSVEIPLWYISYSGDYDYDNIDTYYVRAYGVSYHDSGFTDLETGLRIYPSMNIEGGSGVEVLVTN